MEEKLNKEEKNPSSQKEKRWRRSSGGGPEEKSWRRSSGGSPEERSEGLDVRKRSGGGQEEFRRRTRGEGLEPLHFPIVD